MSSPSQTETFKNGDAARPGSQALGPMLFRLLHADDLAQPSASHRLQRCSEVLFGRGAEACAELVASSLRIALEDPYASTRHARLFREGARWVLEDLGSTNGTLVDGERLAPHQPRLLADGALVEVGHTFFLLRLAASGASEAAPSIDGPASATLSPEWQLELRRVEQLAPTAQEIFIRGESGAGKEVLARFIHQRSGRTGPFLGVNCGALAEHLLEDELFGHVRGAFSGAFQDRAGLFRAAHGGTLLLDEIGDMPQVLQVRLLRVLDDHRVRPLGSERELEVDVRVIAATHRDLDALVVQGKFRQDLQARLGLLPVRVPALRERREDLGLLIRALLVQPGKSEGLRFELDALRLLLLYSWPLNIRELARTLQAAATLARAEGRSPATIALQHLPASLRSPAPPSPPAGTPAPGPRRWKPPRQKLSAADEELRARLLALLKEHAGNVTAVSRALSKGRTQVQRWIARFEIDVVQAGAQD